MEPVNLPERLHPSSPIGDAGSDRLEEKRQTRRKKVKPPAPATPEAPPEEDDESHQLDELA